MALRIQLTVVAALVGCEGPAAVDVSPGEAEDEVGGKADGDTLKTELKVTIDASHIRRARSRLGLLNVQSQTRRIWFYDTLELDLYEAGVILRAREIDGDDDDTTVKLRPFTLGELNAEFRALDDLKCEIDRDPDSESTACSLKADQEEGAIADVGDRLRQLRVLFTSEQEAMFAAHGPGLGMTELERLGPIPARVWTIRSGELPEKVTAELWYMPSGGQVLELSMKVDAADADDGMADLLDFIDDRDLSLATDQESKTRRALLAFTSPPVEQQ